MLGSSIGTSLFVGVQVQFFQDSLNGCFVYQTSSKVFFDFFSNAIGSILRVLCNHSKNMSRSFRNVSIVFFFARILSIDGKSVWIATRGNISIQPDMKNALSYSYLLANTDHCLASVHSHDERDLFIYGEEGINPGMKRG